MPSISGMFCLVVIATVLAEAAATNYCDPKLCSNRGPHTMCQNRSDKPAAACGKVIRVGCSDADKKLIVDKHNALRQQVASGKVPGQPAAASMPDLIWDEELATIAQRLTNQCDFKHDACRNVERFYVGQNLGMRMSTKDNNKLEDSIQSWFNEVKDLDPKEVSKFTGKNFINVGHYTQLVWADTTKVGCGCITYPKDKYITTFLACNYGPGGNMLGQPIYKAK